MNEVHVRVINQHAVRLVEAARQADFDAVLDACAEIKRWLPENSPPHGHDLRKIVGIITDQITAGKPLDVYNVRTAAGLERLLFDAVANELDPVGNLNPDPPKIRHGKIVTSHEQVVPR